MIQSFGDDAAADLYRGINSARARRFPSEVARVAIRKLDVLDAAERLTDLQSPPGNRLELLAGRWAGWYSIRVNRQWRLVFRWTGRHAQAVRLVDYY